MELTTWENSAQGKILKSVFAALKNYLNQEEVSKLKRLAKV
jgi:hypothetical protein